MIGATQPPYYSHLQMPGAPANPGTGPVARPNSTGTNPPPHQTPPAGRPDNNPQPPAQPKAPGFSAGNLITMGSGIAGIGSGVFLGSVTMVPIGLLVAAPCTVVFLTGLFQSPAVLRFLGFQGY